MTKRISRTIAVLGTAGLVALAGYAIGTGSDGSATAAAGAGGERPADRIVPPHRFGPGGHPGSGAVAERLGVDEQKLRAALRDLRGELGPPERVDLAAELAKELDVDEAKVEAAFERLHERRAAEHRRRADEFAEKLAQKLGIPADKVKEALPQRAVMRARRGGPRHGPAGPPFGPPPAVERGR